MQPPRWLLVQTRLTIYSDAATADYLFCQSSAVLADAATAVALDAATAAVSYSRRRLSHIHGGCLIFTAAAVSYSRRLSHTVASVTVAGSVSFTAAAVSYSRRLSHIHGGCLIRLLVSRLLGLSHIHGGGCLIFIAAVSYSRRRLSQAFRRLLSPWAASPTAGAARVS